MTLFSLKSKVLHFYFRNLRTCVLLFFLGGGVFRIFLISFAISPVQLIQIPVAPSSAFVMDITLTFRWSLLWKMFFFTFICRLRNWPSLTWIWSARAKMKPWCPSLHELQRTADSCESFTPILSPYTTGIVSTEELL